MSENVPKAGVELVVLNAAKATRDINAFVDAMRKEVKVSKEVSTASGQTSKLTDALSKDFSKLGQNMLSNLPVVGRFSSSLQSLLPAGEAAAEGVGAAATGGAALSASLGSTIAVIGAVTVALAAAGVALYGFYKLGARGAEIQNSLEAFNNIVGGLEDSTDVLNGLRKATRGTVSDAELMRLSVAALQGQSTEFKGVLLQNVDGVSNLGRVFDITARAARASGQNVEIVREKFLTGLRLQSKLRLDDIGVTVRAEEANEKYAKSLNKAATALTEAEKKQAFLNEALSQLDKIAAEAPINTLQDALARVPATFQNLKDKVALLVLPIFKPIAEVVSKIITIIIEGFNHLIYFLAPIFKVIGAIISETFKTVSVILDAVFGGMASGAVGTTQYIIAAFQIMGDFIVAVIQTVGLAIRIIIGLIQAIFRSIGSPIQKFFSDTNDDINLSINQIAFNLGKGGALIIGSFATGILKGGTYVLKAVTAIAQIVADFLMGFSPPKRGILSQIDVGGENVAIAWTDGFLGGVEKSFNEVTKFVNDRLGSIANMSRDQLQAGLAALDLAIRPFKESLAIVKSDMQAIAGFTDPALKILERQRTSLLKAFGEGQAGLDVDKLRAQDRQIEKLKELKAYGEDQVAQSELQLAIAEAQQSQQRTLYQIALDRLGAEEKISDAAKQGKEDASDRAEKEQKGGGSATEPGAGGAPLDLGAGSGVDLLSNEAIDKAKAQLLAALAGVGASGLAGAQEGFAESGAAGALADFKAQGGQLKGVLSKIKDSNPVQAIAAKFSGLKDSVSGAFTDFQTFIDDTFKNLFGENGTVTITLNKLRDKFNEIFINEGSPLGAAKIATETFRSSVDGAFKSLFGADGTITGFLTSIKNKIDEVFGGGEGNPLQTAVTTIGEIKTEIEDALGKVFEMDVSAAAQTVYDAVLSVFDEAKQLVGELASSEAVTSIKTELKGIMDGILDELAVIDVDAIVTGFENVLARIQSAIESFPTGVLEKGKEIVDSVTGAISGIFGGGGDDTVQAQRGDQDSAQNLLQGLTIGLPEETRAKLQEVGAQITAAIALGIGGEEAVATITAALTGLYDQVSTTFSSLFIGEESVLFLAQTGLVNFVLLMTEQLELLRSTFETTTLAIDSYLTGLFVNEGGTIPRLPLIMQGVMDQIIGQFMRLTNEGEGTLRGALASLTTIIRGSLVSPVVAGMEAMANSIINGMNQLIMKFNALPIPFSIPLIQYITVTAPGFAKGTLGYDGAFIAGERGRELIMPSKNNPMSVFPNRATLALERLASISQPAPMPHYAYPSQGAGGSSSSIQGSYNTNKNLTVNAKHSMTRLEMIQLMSNM